MARDYTESHEHAKEFAGSSAPENLSDTSKVLLLSR
jgi:hypothetical protein